MPKTIKDHIEELQKYHHPKNTGQLTITIPEKYGTKEEMDAYVQGFKVIQGEYNWKKAALCDSNAQLKKAFEEIETLKKENQAKSLVIVDLGLDAERDTEALKDAEKALKLSINDKEKIENHWFQLQIIVDEVERATKKHPNWPDDIFKQIAIINEEAGEATRAVLHYVDEEGSTEDIEKELIHTAATCIRMLNKLDKSN